MEKALLLANLSHHLIRNITVSIDILHIFMVFEGATHTWREIYMDGRPHPRNWVNNWWGHSTGKWEGDTLVVETTGFLDTDPQWLDVQGSPLTETAKVTEKFRRVNYGTMEIEITVDDPKAYTKPWTVRVNQRIMPEQEIIEFICEENQRFGKQ